MRANGNGNGGYDAEVWNQIKAEWLAGLNTDTEIKKAVIAQKGEGIKPKELEQAQGKDSIFVPA